MTATQLLHREDAYLTEADAKVLAVTETGNIVLDQTLFYATGGGQPGDRGCFTTAKGETVDIVNTLNSKLVAGQVEHVASAEHNILVGDSVHIKLDWDIRYRCMRVHTALHLLSVVLPYPVTGGSIGECLSADKVDGRLDFDIAEPAFDKEELSQTLQTMVAKNTDVSSRWISDAELDAQPELVKTMSVQPPRSSGQVRLIEIPGLDLQPCGGTHLANIGEIGQVRIKKIENKGKINRRVRIVLD